MGDDKFLIYSLTFMDGNKALIGTESGLKIIDLNTQALRPIPVDIRPDSKVNQVIPNSDGG